jgi:hypothetical protein
MAQRAKRLGRYLKVLMRQSGISVKFKELTQ